MFSLGSETRHTRTVFRFLLRPCRPPPLPPRARPRRLWPRPPRSRTRGGPGSSRSGLGLIVVVRNSNLQLVQSELHASRFDIFVDDESIAGISRERDVLIVGGLAYRAVPAQGPSGRDRNRFGVQVARGSLPPPAPDRNPLPLEAQEDVLVRGVIPALSGVRPTDDRWSLA